MQVARLFLIGIALSAGDAAAAQVDALIHIDAKDCVRLVRHQPRPDVAYKPGVDVRGRPVAPADVGGGVQLPVGEISIPIEIDLAKRYGASGAGGGGGGRSGFQAEAQIGTVTVKDGQALFNGQPMTDYDQNAILQACKARGFR